MRLQGEDGAHSLGHLSTYQLIFPGYMDPDLVRLNLHVDI